MKLNKPKVIFLIRLYSAFEESLKSREWAPSGMPTTNELFRRLTHFGIAYTVYCTANTENFAHHTSINIPEIGTRFNIFPPLFKIRGSSLGFLFNRLNSIWMKARALVNIIRNTRDCIFYIDRENVILGACLVLLGKTVVLRLHGVATLYEKWTTGKMVKQPIRRWAYRAKFSKIIATLDGSPVQQFLDRFTHPDTEKHILVNGAASPENRKTNIRTKHQIKNSYPILLFVSRLVPGKGVQELYDVVGRLRQNSHRFNVLIIGEGPLRSDTPSGNTASDGVTLHIGKISHGDIMNYYGQADIYVSLNKLGCLPNTVLEAIAAGLCIVMLKNSTNFLVGEELAATLKNNINIVEAENLSENLYRSLHRLLSCGKSVQVCRKETKVVHRQIIRTWEERIDEEIAILFPGVSSSDTQEGSNL